MGRNGISKLISLWMILIAFGLVSSLYHDEGDSLLGKNPNFSQVRRVTGRVLREVIERPSRASRHLNQRREKRHIPVSSTKHPEDEGHLERLKLELPLDSTNHILELQLNRDLITDGYFEKHQKDSKDVIHKPSYEETDLCHYRGKIRGRPQSWAALSTCEGIRGVVFDGKELHYLEPFVQKGDKEGEDADDDKNWEILHYKDADHRHNFSCGHDEHKDVAPGFVSPLFSAPHNDSNLLLHSRSKRSLSNHDDTRVPFNSNGKSRFVEMVIVVDNRKYKDMGGDLKQTVRRSKDIANIVNALYQPFNIFIALVGVVVWTEVDEITISKNGDETLSAFLHYRRERLLKTHPNDNAQLLTGEEFKDGVVGKAMQGPICSYKYSGGVNSDFRNNLVGIVATTVAHELGHNFGLSHDNDENCQCSSPGNRCIMAASASSNRTSHWSSCSLKDMAHAFDHGMDYCLRNIPKTLYDGPTCGNGFTEPGEECDCGLPEHCDNPCCDAANCLMHDNATCASGTCCDTLTCHVKSGGTPCRETAGLCDLPEYCTGESEFCPEDVHKLDGLTCQTPTGQAYCYNGECRTHTDQCKLLWGPSGNNSDELCYQRNSNGSRLAHCGYDLVTEKYSQCKTEDSKCGVLHCQMNSEKLEFGYESAAILASFFVNSGGKIYPCRSVVVDFGLRDVSPGMVPDGASCGNERMCVSQKCVPVKSIVGTLADGCADCSGHGVCNSKGHCHCEDGYGGHLCEGSGYGGSIDSGPVYHRGTSKFAKALYVTFFGFIPLIAIISFYFYYANDSLKKLCLEIRRNGLRAVAQPPVSGGPNKPTSNGHAGGGGGNRTVSSPQSQNNSGPTSPGQSGGQSQDPDFFGNYKGFSLSPIKSSPKPTRNGSANSNGSLPNNRGAAVNVIVNNNNNTNSLPNGHIQSSTNENVYYSPIARVESEVLVKNSDKLKPNTNSNNTTLKNPHHSNFLNKGNTRVSWAQPIASRLPVSPPSDEESANSDTPLYEQGGSQNSSPVIHNKIPQDHQERQGQGGQCNSPSRARPASSPDGFGDMKGFSSKGNPVKKESSFSGPHSAFSRIAAAFPFVRNSLRSSTSHEDNHRLSKNFPKSINRDTLEISKPILQSEVDQQKNQHCIAINPLDDKGPRYANVPLADGGDQVDNNERRSSSNGRYANIPSSPNLNQLPSKPALKNFQRVKDTTPPPQPTTKPIPKVQRAHSMIQPSSNRNSIHDGNNPHYNSLRRSRPSAPPPKPPDAPPPPPPNAVTATPRTNFFKSSTPPPYNSSSIMGSPSSVRASIMKFSFGRSATGGTDWLRSKLSNHNSNNSNSKTPTSKVEDIPSPTPELPPSPPPIQNKEDNIYDTIDEGIPDHHFEKKAELASSEESSPKKSPDNNFEEKIETLSTGSSENGGLLSEIISEIKCRNRESIYNSIDRKRQKAKKKAAAAAAAEKAREEAISNKNNVSKRSSPAPYISPSAPSTSSASNSFTTSKSSLSRSYGTPKPTPFTMSPPKSSPPLINSSLNKPKPITEKPKVILNPNPSPNTFTPIVSTNVASKRPTLITPNSRNSVSPVPVAPTVISPATSNANIIKPTCAVNGIPKATTVSTTTVSTAPTTSNVTSSPNSYVAKINYFSNLGSSGGNNTPMKPISSLPAPTSTNPGKEIIYAPSSVGINGETERSHLSTIRRSRPSYLSNKDSLVVNEDERNENNKEAYPNTFVKKPGGGIYASLGRKVPAPVIRSNSIEKEKIENQIKAANEIIEQAKEHQTEANDPLQISGGGYKPFNPYLNRPLTFSTFRPNSNNSPNNSNTNNSSGGMNAKNATTLNLTNPKPITLSTYSISNNKTASSTSPRSNRS